jgi:hypothetical protein
MYPSRLYTNTLAPSLSDARMASIPGDAWVKLLLPPGEDGKHEHHGFKWSAPGHNKNTEEWSKEPSYVGGLYLTRRRDVACHLDLHDFCMTHLAPVVEFPEDAEIMDYERKRKVSAVVLGEPVLIADVLGLDEGDASNDFMPLWWAVVGGHIDAAKRLVERVASSALLGVLDRAVREGRLGAVNLLVELGADPKNPVVLRNAVRMGRVLILERLVELGAGLTYPGALMDAVYSGQAKCVKCVVEQGADPKTLEALRLAARTGNLKIVDYLVEQGANPKDRIAMEMAFSHGHPEVAARLSALAAPRYALRSANKRRRV